MAGEANRVKVILLDMRKEGVAGVVGPPKLKKGGTGRHGQEAYRYWLCLFNEIMLEKRIMTIQEDLHTDVPRCFQQLRDNGELRSEL